MEKKMEHEMETGGIEGFKLSEHVSQHVWSRAQMNCNKDCFCC